MLHAYLRDGQVGVAALTRRVRKLNSHRSGGRPPRAEDFAGAPPFPDVDPPSAFDTTIADVAGDGGFPAERYEDSVRAWVADTVKAWRDAR
ncbi:hypothetical protein KALB_4671 [Kutzneria albida DSM 43870]|uniref:Uncharacterized protein n=2 Tax=Kutzneria TaxID=43356 RepID=W5WA66_9PSEU|nr:hypothetical protein KALB_4671 [Kutzneria albida DSM 43870]